MALGVDQPPWSRIGHEPAAGGPIDTIPYARHLVAGLDIGDIGRAPDNVSALRVARLVVEERGWSPPLRQAVTNRVRPLVLGNGSPDGSNWTVWRVVEHTRWSIDVVRELIQCPHENGTSVRRRHDWVPGMRADDRVPTCDRCGDEIPD